jgi:hypothetical protein
MYKRIKNYDAMLKLIKDYHPEVLADTYLHLAKVTYFYAKSILILNLCSLLGN